MAELNQKEFWVVIPFSDKSSALQMLRDTVYDGFVVERNAGEYKAVKNQRIRE